MIMMVDEKMEPNVAKEMIQGGAEPLRSAFHLVWSNNVNFVLQLLNPALRDITCC